LLTACGGGEPTVQATFQPTPQSEVSIVVLPPMTPAVIAAKLTPAATLDAAAKQLAALLGIAPDAVRVRIKVACSVCDAEKLQKATSLNGVSVAKAKKLLLANNDFWLFVKNFICIYHYDGKTYTPQNCQFTSL
jgi:hypothetical protein